MCGEYPAAANICSRLTVLDSSEATSSVATVSAIGSFVNVTVATSSKVVIIVGVPKDRSENEMSANWLPALCIAAAREAAKEDAVMRVKMSRLVGTSEISTVVGTDA